MPEKGNTKRSQTRSEDDKLVARVEASLKALHRITQIVNDTRATKDKGATIADDQALMMICDVLSELKEGGRE